MQLLTAAIGSKLEPVLELIGPDDRVAAESANGLLGYTCPTAGAYAVGVRDREYRGDASMFYRLNIGDIPIVTGVFPLGIQRGGGGGRAGRRRPPRPDAHRPRQGAGRRRRGEPAARAAGHA